MRRPTTTYFLMLSLLVLIRLCRTHDETRVKELIQDWAPLVWLAPGERFLPLGVPEFLDNMEVHENYLRTRHSMHTLLQNRSSFLHGRKPAGNVPIYALVKNCIVETTTTTTSTMDTGKVDATTNRPGKPLAIETNDVAGDDNYLPSSSSSTELRRLSRSRAPVILEKSHHPLTDRPKARPRASKSYKRKLRHETPSTSDAIHFHVTYWMFYPFSEGKAVCVLDLGFFGSWPIPSIGGMCLGSLKEYGSHVGDWEHVSLYFKGKDHPLAMYVSAHDAGAFYRYESNSNSFVYESQETRKGGLFQKPQFPERVTTLDGARHPVLFSARGSHGLWTAPGKHRFVRLPRLYDESGFGIPWPTWTKLELLIDWELSDDRATMPGWMTFTGKWGNPKSNCLPLARIGFNVCEFVDGPTGIPMKKLNFKC